MNEWQEMFDELTQDGWEPKSPGRWDHIDRGIANDSRCPNCNHYGMDYRPFMRGESYRAFAVCDECNHYEEF